MQQPIAPQLAALLDEAIAARIFPGAVVAWHHDARRLQCARGHLDYETPAPLAAQTIYDVASLSKLWTLAAWLLVAREHHIAPTRHLGEFWPAFRANDKSEIQIAHLLDHSSGIECAIQSFVPPEENRNENQAQQPNQVQQPPAGHCGADWIQLLADAPLKSAPGAEVLYSCSNYFLLARLAAKIIGSDLSGFITQRLIEPLYSPQEIVRTTFAPLKHFAGEIAPTENHGAGKVWLGEVHDEAARLYGPCDDDFCGNAGVFADAEGVMRFARLWISDGAHEAKQILHPSDIAACLGNPRLENAETGARRGWCWQIDAPHYMTDEAPRGSIGHLGFTGPALWLHQESQRVCVVLNNRVHPTRNGPNRFPLLRGISEKFLEF